MRCGRLSAVVAAVVTTTAMLLREDNPFTSVSCSSAAFCLAVGDTYTYAGG